MTTKACRQGILYCYENIFWLCCGGNMLNCHGEGDRGIADSFGHDVLTRHLAGDNAWEKIGSSHRRSLCAGMKWLEQCDLFMAEVSGSSFGIGFETGSFFGATSKENNVMSVAEM